MTKFYYFKMTFLSVAAGLFAGLFVYGLFDTDFNSQALTTLFLKSLAVGVITGLLLGILNMFFKIGNFPNKEAK